MNDPVYIQISEATDDTNMDTEEPSTPSHNAQPTDSYSVPDKLQQFMVVVPSKLRLVCLAAFILAKCKVTIETDI